MIGHRAVPHVAWAYLPMGIKLEPVMLSVRRALDRTNTVGWFPKRCYLIGWDDEKSASIWKPFSVPKFPNDSNPQSSGDGNSNIEVFADYPITKREINARKGLVLRQVVKKISALFWLVERVFRLYQCWWRMLETKCIGDDNKILVTVLAFLVTNIPCYIRHLFK